MDSGSDLCVFESRYIIMFAFLFPCCEQLSPVCCGICASTNNFARPYCPVHVVAWCAWCDQPATCFGSDLSNNGGLTSISGTAFYGLSNLTSLDLSVSCCTSNLCLGAGALAPLSALNTLSLPSRWTCTAGCPATNWRGSTVCESPRECSNLPTGCTCTGSTLTSCSGFTGVLFLANVGITSIASGAFSNSLSSVYYLDLSSNVITSISPHAFSGLPYLYTLYGFRAPRRAVLQACTAAPDTRRMQPPGI